MSSIILEAKSLTKEYKQTLALDLSLIHIYPINQFINLISQSKRSIHTFNLFLFIKFQHSVFPFPSFILVTIFKFNIPLFLFFSILHVKNIEYCCIFINTNAFIYAQCIYFFYSGMKHISNLLYQFLYLFFIYSFLFSFPFAF